MMEKKRKTKRPLLTKEEEKMANDLKNYSLNVTKLKNPKVVGEERNDLLEEINFVDSIRMILSLLSVAECQSVDFYYLSIVLEKYVLMPVKPAVKEFCAQNSLANATFYRKRKELLGLCVNLKNGDCLGHLVSTFRKTNNIPGSFSYNLVRILDGQSS